MNKSLLVLLTVTILSGIVLSSTIVSADNNEVIDRVSLTVPIACTMSGTGTTHTATLNPGTYSGATGGEYENGIGKTTLTAICNDDNGFSIYAIGYTGNSYDSENHTKLVGSTTGGTIATKAYTSGDTTSNWSMKLTKITDSAESYNPQNLTIQSDTEGTFSNWHSVPAAYTKVAEYHANTGSSTTDTTLGVKLETTYAAYIASNQAADTYEGQLKYTMVHPYDADNPTIPISCPANYICYSPNSDNTIGTMNVQDVGTYMGDTTSVIGYQSATSNTKTVLIAPNYKRVGYGFIGWSTDPQGDNDIYGPMQDYTPGDISSEGITMYAQWSKSRGTLQDWNGCNNLVTNQVIALSDTRDNNTYAVAKLVDGNCWMIENLRLDNTASMDSINTDNPAPGYSSLPASTDTWCSVQDVDDTIACYNSNKINTNNTNIGGTNAAGDDLIAANGGAYGTQGYAGNNLEWYSYGNSYSWYSATAGNGTYYTYSGEAAGSICPRGWSLPTNTANVSPSDNTTQIFALVKTITGVSSYIFDTNTTPSAGEVSSLLRQYPNNFVYAGAWFGTVAGSRGYGGYYRSLSASNNKAAYGLGISNDYVSTPYAVSKGFGLAVRCVTK